MLGDAQQPSLSTSISTRIRKTRDQVEVSGSDVSSVSSPAGDCGQRSRCRRQQQQSGRQINHAISGVPTSAPSKRSRPPLGFKIPCKSFVDVLTRFARSLGRSPLGVFMQAYLGSQSAAHTLFVVVPYAGAFSGVR